MKKLIILTAILLISLPSISQTLRKGGMVSIHTVTITPNEGVSLKKMIRFLEKEVIPANEKAFGCEMHLTTGLNRDNEGKIGIIFYYDSKKEFNRLWNDDGSATEEGQAAIDKVSDVYVELNKMGSLMRARIEDWIVN